MTRPPWDPDPRYVAGPEPVESPPGIPPWFAAFVLAAVVFTLTAAAIVIVAAPRSAPDPTVDRPGASGGDVAPGGAPSARAPIDASGPMPSGAPSNGARPSGTASPGSVSEVGSDAPDPADPRLSSGGAPPRFRGLATWYCLSGSSVCTRGYGQDDLVAAIDTDLGFAKGDQVVVRYSCGEGCSRAVTVRIVDVCACPGDRLIDLTSGAFEQLAPLGLGVIPVTVELAGAGVTLPPTEGE